MAPPKLIFITCILLSTAHSMPLSMTLITPLPFWFKTFTAYRDASGATPITPISLSNAATIPATSVPCPLSSSPSVVPGTKVTLPDTAKSGWSRSIPLSRMATLTPVPLLNGCANSASTRSTPQGSTSPAKAIENVISRSTNFTLGSAESSTRLSEGMVAEIAGTI